MGCLADSGSLIGGQLMADPPPTFSISAVSRRTDIPVSTLRFYERELPGLFHIRKTAGGHRRYGETTWRVLSRCAG